MSDYLVWYAKNIEQIKYHQLYLELDVEGDSVWKFVELSNGIRRSLTNEEINNHRSLPTDSKIYRLVSMAPPTFSVEAVYEFEMNYKVYKPSGKGCWITTRDKMEILKKHNRLQESGNTLNYVYFARDFPYRKLTNLWETTTGPSKRNYVVETSENVIARCLLMTTDPGDLVLDPTCGSGTTAFVAEQWGRRWITCDTSRVAVALAKQRLMTAAFDYYELAHPDEGVGSGFKYKTVPHITLKSIANNEPPGQETLYDQPLAGARRLHADAETMPNTRGAETVKEGAASYAQRAVISFGHEHAPLERRQVSLAIEEAQTLVPKPKIIVFASFQFDPEAAKDIDEINWPGVTLLKVQMNVDLLTDDLKKKRASNESFWLIGQPDVKVERSRLARNLKAVVDEELIEAYRGTVSLPFEAGKNRRIAVKIVDERGIESLKIVEVK
jgi:adenine-specific DNA-methyltransferase